jgi:hypothetical protein
MQPEEYTHYIDYKNAWQPWSLCRRDYYTAAEVAEMKKQNKPLPHKIPDGSNCYRDEINRLTRRLPCNQK